MMENASHFRRLLIVFVCKTYCIVSRHLRLSNAAYLFPQGPSNEWLS